MKIKDLTQKHQSTTSRKVRQYDFGRGAYTEAETTILHENMLSVYVNEVLTLKMVSTTTDLAALVVGHLYSEGRVANPQDIRSVYVCRNGLRASVIIDAPLEAVEKPLEIRACDCGEDGMMGRKSLLEESAPGMEKARYGEESQEPAGCGWQVSNVEVFPEYAWNAADVRTLICAFEEKTPLYRRTKGIHSCFLWYAGKVRFFCEDIGRHNALDKVIGKALIEGIDLTRCMVFSSGRIPDDMMEKIIRTRIPVLISSGVPTDKAVELARAYHVNLICSAHGDKMNVFSGPEFWQGENG